MCKAMNGIRGAVSFLLLVVFVSIGISPSAKAAALPDGSYECSTGIKDGGAPTFTIIDDVVTDGRSCTGVVVIPQGVTRIGSGAFWRGLGIPSLITSVTIPDSVISIGSSAFRQAYSLSSLSLGNSVTTIEANAFTAAIALTSLTIPNTVTTIGSSAFSNVNSLISLVIPDSVRSIGNGAFFNLRSLTSLSISNSITSISSNAFNNATSLTTLSIPNSVTSIGDNAFASLVSLTTLSIPSTLTTIGAGAFANTIELTSLVIPDSVTSIGDFAFSNTPSLTQYTYCGTNLTQVQLLTADLNGKTRLCTRSVPPMLPSVAPTIAVNNGVITCTAGEYSRSATSVAFSLFIDGNHVATNFSATGDFLPSWLAPWASASTVQRNASLQSASWNLDIAADASRASCWTLAYSNNATGLISSDQILLP